MQNRFNFVDIMATGCKNLWKWWLSKVTFHRFYCAENVEESFKLPRQATRVYCYRRSQSNNSRLGTSSWLTSPFHQQNSKKENRFGEQLNLTSTLGKQDVVMHSIVLVSRSSRVFKNGNHRISSKSRSRIQLLCSMKNHWRILQKQWIRLDSNLEPP